MFDEKKSSARIDKWQSASPTSLSTATAHRIDQQVKRAFRHTYNAESGLRTLVRLGATEMLRAGATRDAVRAALLGRLESYTGHDKPSLLTGESRGDTLRRLIVTWCTEVCEGRGEEAVS